MTRLHAIAAIAIVVSRPLLSAAPVLRAADVQIAIASRTSCDVRLSVTIDGATEIEHRLAMTEGDRSQLLDVEGATPVGAIRDVGATRSLRLRPTATSYALHYSVQHSEARPIGWLDRVRDRCPIWLPTIPTDGRSRAVRLRVELPAGSIVAGEGTTLPAFTWDGTVGIASLGHLPSLVHVPYAAPGETVPWSLPRAIDTLVIGTFATAAAVWIWRVRR